MTAIAASNNPPAFTPPTQRRNSSAAPGTLLILSQVFVPDPASVGQHMADVAIEMARRGHRVIVYTSRRGYDNPAAKYPSRQNLHGVDIRRLPFSSFGKKSLLTRGVGTISFMIQAFFLALFTPNLEGIFYSTSPPLIGLVASLAGLIRRAPVAYWAMDLNPDQLIALGKISPTSFSAKLLESFNRFILRQASLVVALDRFMAQRLSRRANLNGRMVVMPPWPHENHIEPVDQAVNPFRIAHDLAGKFVVMYSGNHSPSNPLATLLDAALAFQNDPSIAFLFIGGGIGKKEVDAFIADHRLSNVLSLPYQPLSQLRYSLSAADVHVVSLGEGMVGIIHPCKVYGAMAVGRPILFFGPRPSHVSDLLDRHNLGWQVSHGDVDAAVAMIRAARATPPATLASMGREAQTALARTLSQEKLCAEFCNALDRALSRQSSALSAQC